MNPCKILEEICHLAVFFKVVPISANFLLTLVTGVSAEAIAFANCKKAY
jgi:hypothetical protein